MTDTQKMYNSRLSTKFTTSTDFLSYYAYDHSAHKSQAYCHAKEFLEGDVPCLKKHRQSGPLRSLCTFN